MPSGIREARAEVEAIAKDFPGEKERCDELLKLIQDLDARQQLLEIGVLRGSRKPKELLARLRAFPGKDVSPEVLADAREQLRKEEDQLAADRKLGESLRELDKGFSTAVEKEWKPRIAVILKALEDCARRRPAAARGVRQGRRRGLDRGTTRAGDVGMGRRVPTGPRRA